MNETRCTDCTVDEELHTELATLLSEHSLDDEQRRAILADARKRAPRDPRRVLIRRLAAAAAVLLVCGVGYTLTRDPDGEGDRLEERVVYGGPLAHVTIEQLLYQKPDGSGGYIRLTVENLSPREIGIDLAAYADVLHRGEWSDSSNEHQRRVISMWYGQGPPLPPERRDEAVRDFEAGELFRLPPHGSADFFRKYSSSRERRVTTPNGTYLAIGANPLLLVTDGERAELITTDHERSSQPAMNRLAKRGIEWATLPDDAYVLPVE